MKTWKPVPINEHDFTYATVMEYDRAHHFSLTISGPTSMLKETWLSVNDYFGRASMPLPDNLRLCELVDDDAVEIPDRVVEAVDMLGGIVTGNVLTPEDYTNLSILRKWIKSHETQ